MSFSELWKFLQKHKIHSYFKWKTHVIIHERDFEKIKHLFAPSKTIFHWEKKSWRSAQRFFHFHAVKFDEFVELHCDFGNFNRHYILGVFHFFGDVIGYVIWCLLQHGKPYHKRDFNHLRKIKTQHPFHLVNVYSSRVFMCCKITPKMI